jgi:glycosyltransferase involved in cell wall biosynthesis
MIRRRLHVLVIAYECSPTLSHTAGSAWQVLSRLAQWHDMWVITESTQYQVAVENGLAQSPTLAEHLHFFFIPREQPLRPKRARPVLPIKEVLDYKEWQRQAFTLGRSLHARIGFDLVHLLRGDSFREPGFCWMLPIPFVWGPTGGRTGVPWRMIGMLGLRGCVLHTLRNMITIVQFHFSPRVRAAARRASCVIAQTAFDQRKFKEVHGIDTVLAHEQAAEPSLWIRREYDGKRPLAIAWAGRCVALKALPIVLHAIGHPRLRNRVVLHVAGDGPYRRQWETQAIRMGVADRCQWHGWLPQDKAIEIMNRCDVLAFTSLLEATSTTVMEALSTGLPVICLKHCGFGDLVDESCGIPIRVRDPRSAVSDFSAALISLLEKPDSVRRLSEGAGAKARAYSWDQLATVIRQTYEKAIVSSQPVLPQTSFEWRGEAEC